MNAPLNDDDIVVARLRTALDEVTAAPSTAAVPQLRSARAEHSAGRWVAIAAATVLVVGAIAAIGVNLSRRDDTGASDTVAPNLTQPVSEATVLATPATWAVLASQDLVPGGVSVEQCCTSFPAPGPATVMAWGAADGLENGLLLLTAVPEVNVAFPIPNFSSNGFSAERVQELTAKVLPGSGLPYVLPDDGVTLLGVGSEGAGRLVSQTYSNDRGIVTVSVGEYRGQLTPLVWYGFHTVLIPGFGVNGYRADPDGGGAYIVWQMPDGQWATLEVPATMEDRVDGLIAALGPAETPVTEESVDTTSTVTATTLVGPIGTVVLDTLVGDALPPYSSEGSDTAVGMPAPQFGTEGTVAAPVEGVRTLVVFTAPWCPHCKKVLPIVIGAETEGLPGVIADGAGGGTKVAIVETASSPGDEIYTPADITAWGHVGPIYVDADAGDGSPGQVATRYGVTGFPYLVLVDADGAVLRRTWGEMDEQALLTFVNG